MSAFGPTTAVVSLGLSCQTAHQIHTHLPLISELLGEPLAKAGSPFDWLIAPPVSAARMIAEDDFFPRDRAELDTDHIENRKARPYWRRRGCFFWHETGLVDRFESFVVKAAHMRRTFESIADRPRRVFFLSNTQTNLSKLPPYVDTMFTDEAVAALRGSLSARFGDHELHVVTYKKKRSQLSPGAGEFRFQRDRTAWKGDDAQWEAVFRQVFAG